MPARDTALVPANFGREGYHNSTVTEDGLAFMLTMLRKDL